jgi:hypothetical protein
MFGPDDAIEEAFREPVCDSFVRLDDPKQTGIDFVIRSI